MNHSPAPWRVDEDERPNMEWNRHIYDADNMAVCFMAHSDGKDDARDVANARLIAAAPETAAERDRLKAANAVLEAALEKVWQESNHLDSYPFETVKQVRAALAAKGEK